jgi:transmembrane sensor
VLAGGALAAGLAAVIVTVVARRGGDASGPEVTAGAAGAERRYATAVGQRDSVRLPDGTRVVLGAASTMTVPADYGATTRTVVLDGEAYFHAEHDAVRPFVVRVGPAAVHDLGTAFTVRHGPDVADGRGRVAVTVTEGAVRLAAVDLAPTPGPVAARDSGIVLRAGERGVVAPVPGRRFAAARVDGSATAVADDTAWTSGRLVFRDAPLVEVAGALRRWYGVELRVADPTLARRHLTATFRGEPLPEVLRVVGLALGARVDRRGDTVVVRPAR